jgi:hypothetical protein
MAEPASRDPVPWELVGELLLAEQAGIFDREKYCLGGSIPSKLKLLYDFSMTSGADEYG